MEMEEHNREIKVLVKLIISGFRDCNVVARGPNLQVT